MVVYSGLVNLYTKVFSRNIKVSDTVMTDSFITYLYFTDPLLYSLTKLMYAMPCSGDWGFSPGQSGSMPRTVREGDIFSKMSPKI